MLRFRLSVLIGLALLVTETALSAGVGDSPSDSD
jgi:hypothetical protein